MKNVGSILISLVFLHALVAHPLLVECIQADGKYFLEIMGCDPCHGLFGVTPVNAGPDVDAAAVAAIRNGTDPCLDLFLDGPGGTRISAHLLPPAPQAANHTIGLHHPAVLAGSVTGATDFNLKLPLLRHRHSHSLLKLRI